MKPNPECHAPPETLATVPPENQPVPNESTELQRLFAEVDQQNSFGPSFFLAQLGAFVRARCPNPSEHLPVVQLHLADAEVLDLCHVIGITPDWIVLAVIEGELTEGSPAMRTELVPYSCITRVTIRASRFKDHHMGFNQPIPPSIMSLNEVMVTPEQTLNLASRGGLKE